MHATLSGVEALEARLRTQPELAAHVTALLDEVENGAARVRLLGQTLTAWTPRRWAELNATRRRKRAAAVKTPLDDHPRRSEPRGPAMAPGHAPPLSLRRQRRRAALWLLAPPPTGAHRLRRRHGLRPAAAKVREHYGIPVHAETVRRTCLHHARRLAATPVTACTRLCPSGATCILVDADGTRGGASSTPPQPRPARIAGNTVTCASQEARVVAAQAHGSATTHYDARLGDVADDDVRWRPLCRATI